MALPYDHSPLASPDAPPPSAGPASRDPRALRIVAKTIYRELRQSGLAEEDLMAIAGELLGLVATEVRERRETKP